MGESWREFFYLNERNRRKIWQYRQYMYNVTTRRFLQPLLQWKTVSIIQEERAKLREGVPYVKLYRYNPKHLCPKLNGYWDNDQIKLWTSFGSTNDSCQPVRHTNSADARLKCISLHILQGTRCGFVVSVWYTELLKCLSYFLTWNIATCILYMVFAMVIRELLL